MTFWFLLRIINLSIALAPSCPLSTEVQHSLQSWIVWGSLGTFLLSLWLSYQWWENLIYKVRQFHVSDFTHSLEPALKGRQGSYWYSHVITELREAMALSSNQNKGLYRLMPSPVLFPDAHQQPCFDNSTLFLSSPQRPSSHHSEKTSNWFLVFHFQIFIVG